MDQYYKYNLDLVCRIIPSFNFCSSEIKMTPNIVVKMENVIEDPASSEMTKSRISNHNSKPCQDAYWYFIFIDIFQFLFTISSFRTSWGVEVVTNTMVTHLLLCPEMENHPRQSRNQRMPDTRKLPTSRTSCCQDHPEQRDSPCRFSFIFSSLIIRWDKYIDS